MKTTDPTPTPLLWLRWGMWALLAMVLIGLFSVWWQTRDDSPRRAQALPSFGEIPEFEFSSSTGARLKTSDLKGPWIADFVFTRCAVICPRMTSKMLALRAELPDNYQLASITVDPAHDTPAVLHDYAVSFGINDHEWLFLTGTPDPLRNLIQKNFMLGISDGDPEDPASQAESITHSTRFVLVDSQAQIRGYYDAFDATSFENLVTDAKWLAAHPN